MQHYPAPWCIGDVFPAPIPPRGPQSGLLSNPAWYGLLTPPSKEDAASDWLGKHGVECWTPTELVPRKDLQRRTILAQRRILPRFLFARFTGRPQWDILLDSRKVSGWIAVEGQPRPIRESEMMGMASVPERIAEIRRREAEARRVRAGDRVMILDGAMMGWELVAKEVDGIMADLLSPLMGERIIRVELSRMVRII